METIKKLFDIGTHFELINGKRLPKVNVVQICPEMLYTNDDGYAVFLCEVMNESEDK